MQLLQIQDGMCIAGDEVLNRQEIGIVQTSTDRVYIRAPIGKNAK